MMMTDTFFLCLLLTSNAVLLTIACTTLLRFERRCRRIEEFWDSPTGTALAESGDEEVREQMKATHRLAQRVGELQQTVKVMETKAPKQTPPVERNLPIGLPLENAVRMARLGASVEDLTRNCGLNNGEARLMQRLHGKVQSAANGQ